jgi:hypothetical protein
MGGYSTPTGIPTFSVLPDASQLPDGLTLKTKDGLWIIGEDLQGTPGAQNRIGSGAPAAELGNDGDTYLDLTTGVLWSKANAEWTAGQTVIDVGGTPINESDIIYLDHPPTAADGVDGQTCFETPTYNSVPKTVYGPKAGGVWPRGRSLSNLAVNDVDPRPNGVLRLRLTNGRSKDIQVQGVGGNTGFTENVPTTGIIKGQISVTNGNPIASLGLTNSDNTVVIEVYNGPLSNNSGAGTYTITGFTDPVNFVTPDIVFTNIGNGLGLAILNAAGAGGQTSWDDNGTTKYGCAVVAGYSFRVQAGTLADAIGITGDHDVVTVATAFDVHGNKVKLDNVAGNAPWPASHYAWALTVSDLQTYTQLLGNALGAVLGKAGFSVYSPNGDGPNPGLFFLKFDAATSEFVLKKLPDLPTGSGKVQLTYDKASGDFSWE